MSLEDFPSQHQNRSLENCHLSGGHLTQSCGEIQTIKSVNNLILIIDIYIYRSFTGYSLFSVSRRSDSKQPPAVCAPNTGLSSSSLVPSSKLWTGLLLVLATVFVNIYSHYFYIVLIQNIFLLFTVVHMIDSEMFFTCFVTLMLVTW